MKQMGVQVHYQQSRQTLNLWGMFLLLLRSKVRFATKSSRKRSLLTTKSLKTNLAKFKRIWTIENLIFENFQIQPPLEDLEILTCVNLCKKQISTFHIYNLKSWSATVDYCPLPTLLTFSPPVQLRSDHFKTIGCSIMIEEVQWTFLTA